jgi:hypothetical protein
MKIVNLTMMNDKPEKPEEIEELNIDQCPVCGKILKSKLQRTKSNHITDCLREQDQFISYSNKKRRLMKRETEENN